MEDLQVGNDDDFRMTESEIATMRAEALAEASANLAKPLVQKAERVITVPKGIAQFGSGKVNPESIRQTICLALLAGATTKDIAAVLQDKYPESAAARKSVIHIAFYRAKLRKSGHLPRVSN